MKYAFALLAALLCMIAHPMTVLASHPKPPHGFWTGKIVDVKPKAITLSVIETWEYGSLGKKDSGTVSFKPAAPGFTIAEKTVANQDLSKHFKAGQTVTLRWQGEEAHTKRIFWDISREAPRP